MAILTKLGVPESLTGCIRRLFDNRKLMFSYNGKDAPEPIQIHSGVGQGGPLGPTLYKFFKLAVTTAMHKRKDEIWPGGLKFVTLPTFHEDRSWLKADTWADTPLNTDEEGAKTSVRARERQGGVTNKGTHKSQQERRGKEKIDGERGLSLIHI